MNAIVGSACIGKTSLPAPVKRAKMIAQSRISQTLLLAVRQTELQRGTLLAHHGRHPAAPRPTQTRKNAVRSAARHEARQRARYIECVNVTKQHRTGGGITGLIDFERGSIEFA